MTEAGLNEREKQLIREWDWLGLIQHGANFFVLEKFARVSKKTNLEVYAAFSWRKLRRLHEDAARSRRALRPGTGRSRGFPRYAVERAQRRRDRTLVS
jgi:hypothetical protein